ncbi:WhiB family transcription factor [Gordonia phage Jumbo]|uniref:WhiB family transcription factor n=1 Tax=Gordonia phage Jumbo TaxID=1887650 RepID=A0A1B3B0K8_9CAUD|nr:transcriptional regulator WhiB-like [Gordonia phage Jumbo]AOE44557.1 WhiB family transcription factor [Gordonia phage Jumbo]
MDETWKDSAACKDSGPASPTDEDIFFPGRGRSDLRSLAREICGSCPVFNDCDDYRNVTGSKHGIWAGKA